MLKLLPALSLLVLVACAEAPDATPDARAVATASVEGATQASYEDAWSALLREIVTDDGLVRYERVGGPLRSRFAEVAEAIETFDAGALGTDAEKMSFWMNAYNLKLVERALDAGTPGNIEAHGFEAFFETPVRVAGMDVTLDQIENVILRRQDGPAALEAMQPSQLDPRLHVGLNCGAVSCPRLRGEAFTPETVDGELDEAMRDFVNSPSHLRFDGDAAVLSSLLDWFAADWDSAAEPAGDYLLGYLDEGRPDAERLRTLLGGRTAAEIKAQPAVRFAYDWTLNAAR